MACGRKLGSYDCCSVVCGDCLELMRELPDGCVDAVITDPPYGIAYNPSGGNGAAQRGNLPPVYADDRPFKPSPFLGFPQVVLFGANHFCSRLPDSDCWLVWYKRDGVPSIAFGDCELAWTNLPGQSRVYNHLWHGMLRDSERGELRVHPTQKPVALMEWCIEQAGFPETILDPFLGSGTTAVAAKKLGRHFLGFEISEDYCRIARERIALVEAQPNLFEPKAEQLVLG